MTDDTHINELFIQLANGDETAFRALYDRYRTSFYGAALKMTHSPHLAEEIVQEVFVALWDKRLKVAAARNPVGYLLTMLHNSIYAHFRRILLERQMRQRLAGSSSHIDENSVEELLLAKENRELLQAVIGQLPPQQQLVYRLAKQEGLSREEIAQQLNISSNTVRNHLAAAVEFLRNYFQKDVSSIIWVVIWHQL